MSIIVKTLACGSLTNGNSSNTKPLHIRQNTGGVMSSRNVKVSLAHFLIKQPQIFDFYNEEFRIEKKSIDY
jgi:hypothetical protein